MSDIVNSTSQGSPISRRRFLAVGALGVAGTALMAASPADALTRARPALKNFNTTKASTMTFLTWDSLATMQPVVALFEKLNPSITVEMSYAQPVDGYIDTLRTRLLAGTGPDVFVYVLENKDQLNHYDYVYDLSNEPLIKVMAAANRGLMSNNGGVWGLSVSAWASGIFYNERLLDKVGSGPAQTWDDFLALCAKFKQMGLTPYSGSAQPDGVLEGLIGGYYKYHRITDADQEIFAGTSSFVKEWKVPLSMYDQLYSKGLVPSSVVGVTGSEMVSQFANGTLASYSSGPWDVPGIRQSNPSVKFMAHPVPLSSAGQTGWCGAPSQGWAINSKAKNSGAALAFLEFLASERGLAAYAKSSGSIITTSNYVSHVDPALTLVAEAARSSDYYYTGIAWPAEYADELGDYAAGELQLMIEGKLTPKQVEEAMDTKVKRLQA